MLINAIQTTSTTQCATAPLPAVPPTQELNPLPFLGMIANTAAWLFYGTLIQDPYVYFSNILGLVFGAFFTLTCYKFAKEKVNDRIFVFCSCCCNAG